MDYGAEKKENRAAVTSVIGTEYLRGGKRAEGR
jgi:hypothetical protein